MEPRRRIIVGLAGTAICLIVVGAATVLLDAGSTVGGPSVSFSSGNVATATQPIVASPSPSQNVIGPTGIGSPGPSPLVSPSPLISPTPSRHTVGFATTQAGIAYFAEDGTVVPVSMLPGLRLEVRGGKASYYALAGNRFGLKAGAYAGEFKPNVIMQQPDGSSAQSGGMVVVGPVAARLITDQLGLIKAGKDKWVVALPVDPRSEPVTSTVSVSFDSLGLHGISDTPRVVVRYDGQLPVTNAIPTNGGFHVLVEGLSATAWQVIDPTRLGLAADRIDPAHTMNELLVYGSGAANLTRNFYFDGRVVVGQKMLTAAAEVSVSLAVQGSHADLGPDKILSVGDVPIFVAAS